MPALPGLGTFAESFMGAYGGMHRMDMAERELALRRQAAEQAARKQLLEEQKLKAEQEAALAEQEEFGAIAAGTRDLPPHEITGALPGLISRSRRPLAAAGAAEKYLKGIGGAQPWEQREKMRAAQEWASWVGVHRKAPGKVTLQDVMDQASLLNIPEAAVKLAFPEREAQMEAMRAYYEAVNRRAGAAAGGLVVPGAPVTPGAPAPIPGRPGSMVPTERPAHELEAGQAAIKAEEEASARYRGAQQATGLTDPLSGRTFGELEAAQARRMAEARETDLDRQLKQAKLRLDQAEREMDPIKRAKLAAETVQLLVTSGYYVQGIPTTDPAHQAYQDLLARGRTLAQSGTQQGAPTPLPGRPTLPGTSTTAPAGGRIRVRRKDSGLTGTIPADRFDPNVHERL